MPMICSCNMTGIFSYLDIGFSALGKLIFKHSSAYAMLSMIYRYHKCLYLDMRLWGKAVL